MVGQKSWLFVIIYSGLFTCELDVTVMHCIFAKHIIYIPYVQFVLTTLSIILFRSYEVVPTSSQKNNKKIDQTYDEDDDIANEKYSKSTCNQFTLRRMACFGSPKYDRKEPLHILSADSRFPDVEPKRIRRVGNHFLALFPVTRSSNGGLSQFRKHALIRGGSRIVPPLPVIEEKPKKATSKWFGGQGSWAKQ